MHTCWQQGSLPPSMSSVLSSWSWVYESREVRSPLGVGMQSQHRMTLSLCLDLRLWEGSLLFLHCLLWPPEPYETQQAEPMSFFRGLRLVMSHGPYIKLIAGFLFTSLAFMVSGGPDMLSLGALCIGRG